MGPLLVGIMGGVAILAGLYFLMTRRETAESFERSAPRGSGAYTPGAAGCAGILFVIVGVGFVVVAIVVGVT